MREDSETCLKISSMVLVFVFIPTFTVAARYDLQGLPLLMAILTTPAQFTFLVGAGGWCVTKMAKEAPRERQE